MGLIPPSLRSGQAGEGFGVPKPGEHICLDYCVSVIRKIKLEKRENLCGEKKCVCETTFSVEFENCAAFLLSNVCVVCKRVIALFVSELGFFYLDGWKF